jgi:ketosteroid isomerase-like protein
MGSTKEILDRHLKCFGARDLDGIMADYEPNVVLFSPRGVFSPDGIAKGKAAVRQIFQSVFGEFGKPGMSFNLRQMSVEGDYAYLFWSAQTADHIYEAASDTFVVKDGKIVAQAFSASIAPKS